MSSAFQPDHIRLSDAERADAMNALGHALGEGRLSLSEYDERCREVAAAQVRADLDPLFADIPQRPGEKYPEPGQALEQRPPSEMTVYTAREIVETRRKGQRIRAGVFWLGTFTAAFGVGVADTYHSDLAAGFFALLIPTLFVLLYVMKVGPDDWYMPNIRQLEKNRRQAVRAKQLELEATQSLEQAQRKLERKAQLDQLTGDALGVAQHTVNRFKPRS